MALLRDLPQPDAIAQQHSEKLIQLIADKIVAAGGQVTFRDFMQLALYAPGLGYYAAGSQKFGAAGDFVTAPEISLLFGRCIARFCESLFPAIKHKTILELGAGSGKLAASILASLPEIECYYILDISSDLRARQQELLSQLSQEIYQKIIWLDSLTTHAITGIVIANEVMDAFPIHRFCWQTPEIYEYYIRYEKPNFHWHLDKPSSDKLAEKIRALDLTISPYSSEINLMLEPWINSLSALLQQGAILLIDYGFPRSEYYHPERSDGTLMCHYRHYAHSDPFYRPGLQDITAHIDFTAVAEAAIAAKLQVAGYTSQSAFLLDCGLLDMAEDSHHKQQIKYLTLPSEMGELFKVMALTKNIDLPLRGFQLQDRRHQL